MTKYGSLDEKILKKIGAGPTPFLFIHAGDVREECDRIAKAENRESFRIVDARLQALRRKGLIRAIGKGWIYVGAKGERP